MNRRVALLVFTATLVLTASEADAARPLLAELLARAPVDAGQPVMSPLALEACLRQARELEGLVVQRAVTENDTVSQIIETKNGRRERETTPVTLASLGIYHNLHDPSSV